MSTPSPCRCQVQARARCGPTSCSKLMHIRHACFGARSRLAGAAKQPSMSRQLCSLNNTSRFIALPTSVMRVCFFGALQQVQAARVPGNRLIICFWQHACHAVSIDCAADCACLLCTRYNLHWIWAKCTKLDGCVTALCCCVAGLQRMHTPAA